MIKNIFIKSILRQKIRSLLLFTIIGIAAFAFVLRTVEYIVIHRHLNEVGRNYRAIGFLRGQTDNTDITQAANLLANSPFMGYEDRQRRVQGILHDLYSPDVAGMGRMIHPDDRRLYSAAYFIGHLHSVNRDHESDGLLVLDMTVVEILAGSPYHVAPFQRIRLHYEFPPGEDTSYVDNLVDGQRYLFKGHFYRLFWGSPEVGRLSDFLVMQHIPSDEEMQAEIERIQRDSRAITLHTTSDMTALPDIQGRNSPMSISRGRHLNRDDYLNANPVAVVSQSFAWPRGLNVGNTFTVTVYQNQYTHRLTLPSTWETGDALIASRTELAVGSSPDERGYIELELEIVGIYNTFYRTDRTFGCGVIYVPDSIIPAYIQANMIRHLPEGNLPAAWYGFVLNSTRQEQVFFLEYRELLAATYNVSLHMFRSGGEVFWTAADSILLVTAFNAIVFGLVVVLVLSLVSFIYAKQRQKEFAIARSLGVSVKKILLQICISVLMIAMPAAIIGGGIAWHFAMEEAAYVLEPFGENLSTQAPNPFRHDFLGAAIREAAQPDFSYIWLAGLIGVFFTFVLAMVLINVIIHLRRPVLTQLQGRSAANTWVRAANILDDEVPDYAGFATSVPLSTFEASPKWGASFKHTMGWILTHITRSPAKTALSIAIALFFVIAIGWLQESIRQAEGDINYLYDNTVVHVELETNGVLFTAFERLRMIRDSGYFDVIDAETFFYMSFVVPKDDSGNVPYDWQEIIGFTPNVHTNINIEAGVFDTILGTGDLDAFIADNSVVMLGDDAMGLVIDLVEGFDPANFVYDDRTLTEVIPIIISQHTANIRGISLGETVYFGYNHLPTALSPWHFAHAKVVGIHNQHIHMLGLEDSAIVPVSLIESITGAMTMYYSLRLTVDTAFNRELDSARYTLDRLLLQQRRGWGWNTPLELRFYDEELRNLVSATSQIILLLELLYPVAVGFAVAVGAAVAVLLLLQMEHNAAIVRMLGASRFKTWVMLCTEQIIVCSIGLIIGLVALMLMSWGFGLEALLEVAGIYMASVVAGAIVGAVIITARAPIDLLQVRE